ncbi:MAG: hypothetical protein J5714_00570 [Alphaproteobacteria bacterium]|nr:hypothetical protein [Alphaproteobacteria bacterium]
MAGQILKITKEGVFADGQPTITYNGVRIDGMGKFADVLRDGVVEVELMQSDTKGKYGVAGSPSPDADGRYTWIRVKTNVKWSDWIFRADYSGIDRGATVLKQNILKDACLLHSNKRSDFRSMVREDLKVKR